ncbi:MAG: hypothetical protein ACW980_21745 [Promethearchaeota archaeon]|jgi:hypothetical protein
MTNLLYKYSKRKHGWRVRFLLGEDGKNPITNKLMIINGMGAEYLIEVPEGTPEDKVGHYLEDLTTKFLKDVEERDMLHIARESLMFAVFAKAIRSQSQQFVGLLTKDKKHDLQMFNNHVDKMTRSLEVNFGNLIGKEQTDKFLEDMEDVVFNVFLKFKDVIDTGRLEEFEKYVQTFDKETKVSEMKVEN